MKPQRALVLLSLLGLFAMGCSLRKTAYGLADRLLLREMDKVVTLEPSRRDLLRGAFRQLMRWHRAEELPRYAALLQRTREQVADGFTPEEALQLASDTTAALGRLGARLAQAVAPRFAELSEGQIAQLQRNLTGQSLDEQDRYRFLDRPQAEYLARRSQKGKKQLLTWTGDATAAQMQIVEDYFSRARPHELRRREVARQNRAALVSTLRARPGEEAIAALLERWMARQQVQVTPDYQQAELAARDRFLDLLVRLDATLTPAQRQHFMAELASWERDLRELSRRKDP